MSEDDIIRQLELLGAKNIDNNGPLIDKITLQQQHIDVSTRIAPPGLGKTRDLMKDWRERGHGRYLFLSFSHELLDEQYKRMKDIVTARHLYGLRFICPCLNEQPTKVITALADAGLSNKHICTVCKSLEAYPQHECAYQHQFDDITDIQIVFAPIEYSATQLFDKYDPDNITVDDCLLRFHKHPTKTNLEFTLQTSQEFFYGKDWMKRENAITILHQMFNLSTDDYFEIMRILNCVQKDKIDMVKNMNLEKPLGENFRYMLTSPEEFDIYRDYALYHGYQEQFATPQLFYCFDWVFQNREKDKHLKIMEAAIQPEILSILKIRYLTDRNVDINFYADNFHYAFKDQGSIIYEVLGREGSWLPAQTSVVKDPSTRYKIQDCIKSISANKSTIGVVKPKKCDLYLLKGNFQFLDFGNLRGKNALEYCELAFVVGTWNVRHEDLVKDFKLFAAHNPTTEEHATIKPEGSWFQFKDKELDAFRWHNEEYEQAQAIMRFRPELHKVKIYVFGLVPKIIEDWGFKVDRTIKLGGEGLKQDREEWLICFMVEHNNSVSEEVARDEMAKKFNIRLDTAYREIKKIVKGNDCLRCDWNGILTYES
jgi:hypothetical protein